MNSPRSLTSLSPLMRRRLVAVLAACLLVAVLALVAVHAGDASSPSSNKASATAVAYATLTGSPAATGLTASPTITPTAPPFAAVVPVVGFWSPQRSIARADLAHLLAGEAPAVNQGFKSVVASSADLTAIANDLQTTPAASVRALSPADVKAAVSSSASTVGLLRVDDVTPDVRALAVDGVALFGSGRLTDLTAWPLLIPTESPSVFASSRVWTLDAGGDVNLDRYVFAQAVTKKKGPDYPWNGGTAELARLACCNGFGGAKLTVARLTGNAGAVRNLLSKADVSVINLEGPAPDNFKSTMTGYNFTFDPDLLAGLSNAGIDAVSLANNHMCNGGTSGIPDTLENLDSFGIAHFGAGPNSDAARKPAILEANGVRVALLGYDAIKPGCWATETRAGTARLRLADVQADIKAARAAGAEVVVVMPHWGTEYTDFVPSAMRREADSLVAAGADLVLGSHSHWVGQIQAIPRPQGPAFVSYEMGNFIFDITHDERTEEGVLEDFTFVGSRLVQVDLHPTLIVNRSQPNLMDPAGTGARVLDIMQKTSQSHLHW